MANVFEVAKYILSKEGPVSTLKLQKFCYYSQAWAMAWTERPLFNEEFEAWVNGPVCRELFNFHKGEFMVSEFNFREYDDSALTDDEKDTIDTILKTYGDMDPYELREQTHAEAPWQDARQGCSDDAHCENIISKESMALYYGNL